MVVKTSFAITHTPVQPIFNALQTMIQRIALQHIFLKYRCCPASKLSPPKRLDPIAHRYDNIQTIDLNRFVLRQSIMQNLHITMFLKFPLGKHILNMSCDYGLIFLKQRCQLRLRQPYGVTANHDFQASNFVWLIYYNFSTCRSVIV